MTVAVIGAGAFGTAMAVALAKTIDDVSLYTRSAGQKYQLLNTKYNNKYLYNIRIPNNINVTNDLGSACEKKKVALLCIPAQQTRKFCTDNADILQKLPIAVCSKGIDYNTSQLQTDILSTIKPLYPISVLTGPSFAIEIAKGLPTALTLACQQERIATQLQKLISTNTIRIYTCLDTTGAQVGGALKNCIAIACGVVQGLELGESAKIALMTRGFSEMRRMGIALGGKPETFFGLSGLGDLTLTCNSNLSRNLRLGLNLAQNKPTETVTCEGIKTTFAALRLGNNLGLDLPIINSVRKILNKKGTIEEIINDLLSRPLKREL